ncbi:cob(I)yrinic acid a,c-diamide adenosyltransferase [Elusimicrobiota bacterium]
MGITQVYTGDGKGKTTAAVGQAIRAASAGYRVLFVFFNKSEDEEYGEDRMMKKIGIECKFFASRHPSFYPEITAEQVKKETMEGLGYVIDKFSAGKYDIIIMDEILISVRDGFIEEEDLLNVLNSRPENIDLVLTGRGATESIQKSADTVSNIQQIKHHYQAGNSWRKGIEK